MGVGPCTAAAGGVRGQRFTGNRTWGDTVRGVIVRFLAVAAVLVGVAVTGAGVAAADQKRPVGGDNPSAPSCGASDINVESGCVIGEGPFF
jgi:hypothetical protein